MNAIDPQLLEQATKAHNKAKVTLMSTPDSVFFTTILFSLKFEWNNQIPTACVDGITLSINPQFYMGMGDAERVFLLLHEVGHVIFQHMARLGTRCPDRWNIAGDHVINLMLLARGLKMPQGGMADPQYTGMSTEEVYDLLPNNPGKPQMQDIVGPPSDGNNPQATAALQGQLDSILIRAALQSKMGGDAPGTIPGSMQVHLDKLLNPKLPWNRILMKEYAALNKTNYTWRKPNRRFFPDYYLPSMEGEQTINLVFALDASGSVSDAEFTRFVTEMQGVLRMHKPGKITVIVFDTHIRSVTEIRSVAELKAMTFTGRGGTRVGDVMAWAEQHKPTMMLVFTDGHFSHVPAKLGKTKLVWLIHGHPKFTAPYGKVIHYDI